MSLLLIGSITRISVAQTMCIPQLDLGSQVVSCADPRATLDCDVSFQPDITDSCDLTSIELSCVPWVEVYDDVCVGDTAYVIYRMWSWNDKMNNVMITLGSDTTYVAAIDIASDSLVCPEGIDTIYCGDDLNAIDSFELRAPLYQIPGIDTFPILPDRYSYCNVNVNVRDEDWEICGDSRMVIRTWTLHQCGNSVICSDTLVLLDTTPPVISYDSTGLSMEFHDLGAISGTFLTDTIGTTASCLGSGLVPYAFVGDDCSADDLIEVTVTSMNGNIYHFYKGNEIRTLTGIDIPPEKEVVFYKIKDACHNYTYDTVVLVVEDRTAAVAACHNEVNLTLTNTQGLTLMRATSMNADSYDNCGIYTMLARRTDWETACGYDGTDESEAGAYYRNFADWVEMDPGICKDAFEFGFADRVPFCCEDVGSQIKVELLVIDQNCNVDLCWGYVNVEDKIAPRVLQALPDISINCGAYDRFYAEMFEQSDTNAIRDAFGKYVTSDLERGEVEVFDLDCSDLETTLTIAYQDGVVYDNCGSNLRERYTLPSLGCENNMVLREFIALLSEDQGTVEFVFATQRIELTTCALEELDIRYPLKDTTIFGCGVSYGLDGNSTFITPGPVLPDGLSSCSNIGMGYFDKVYDVVSGDGCNKVHRTWCIVDWCQVDFRGAWSEMIGMPGVLTFSQYIKVMDTIAPEITMIDFDSDIETPNCSMFFNSTIDATDGCGTEPAVEWLIQDAETKEIIHRGVGETANPSAPLLAGSYQLLWRASDQCNNVTEVLNPFTVTSNALPAVVNHSSMTIVLTPMDLDNDGDNESAMSQIWAEEYNSSSAPPCGGDIENLIFLLSRGAATNATAVPDYSATGLSFDCSDFQTNPTPIQLTFWVVDTFNNTADYSHVVLMLYDNHNICSGTATGNQPLVVSGRILTENQREVANVDVKAMDDDLQNVVTTGLDGNYQMVLSQGKVAMVKPEKDTDHANGLSTADLVRIQRHILGLKKITSPYQLIAADANRDGQINPIDLIQIRRLILRKTDVFPNNTSWRFVDADFQFDQTKSVFAKPFPEAFELKGARSIDQQKDFIAIKVGDLDGNVFAGRSTARQYEDFELLHIKDAMVSAGQLIEVPVMLANSMPIEGAQMSIVFDPAKVELIKVLPQLWSLDEETMQIVPNEHSINISWLGESESLQEEPLFRLKLLAKEDLSLSDVLSLDKTRLQPEAYIDGETNALKMEFVQDETVTKLQNRPNPFRHTTTIEFELPTDDFVKLKIMDAAGRLYKQIDGFYEKGNQQIIIDADALPTGVLYYQLQSANTHLTRKMVHLK